MHTAKTFAASAALATALCAAKTSTASMATWQENAATPTVTIIVDADMTLSQALTANGVSLSGAASLVKTGNGTVTVDDASGIASFAGEIHVFQGGWSVGTASGLRPLPIMSPAQTMASHPRREASLTAQRRTSPFSLPDSTV